MSSMSNTNINDTFANMRNVFKRQLQEMKKCDEQIKQMQKGCLGNANPDSKPPFSCVIPEMPLDNNDSETPTTHILDITADTKPPTSYTSLVDEPSSEPDKTEEQQRTSRMIHRWSKEVPSSELKRRQRVEAELRKKCAELNKNDDTPSFKPLEWENASLHYKNSVNNDSSSSAQLLGKRKSQDDDNYSSSKSVLACQDATSILSSMNSSLSSSPSSKSTNSSNMPMLNSNWQNPMFGGPRQWTEAEAQDFLDFANKWITPDMNKRFKK